MEGEISGLKRAASGHLYFDLEGQGDGQIAVLSCKVWRSQLARALAFEPRDGQRVVAAGTLDLFPPHGRYSLTVDKLSDRKGGGVGLWVGPGQGGYLANLKITPTK